MYDKIRAKGYAPMAAVVRIGLVKKQVEAICRCSQRVKHLVREALERVKANPAAYSALERVPERIAGIENCCVRKIEIRHGRHDYRMLYLHRQEEGGVE